MRHRTTCFLLAAAAVGVGCNSSPTAINTVGDDAGTTSDVGRDVQVPTDVQTPGDVQTPTDTQTPTDAPAGSLAAVRAAITGTAAVTLSAALSDLVVTARVAATAADGGVSANDPAGFFVQQGMTGPAIFVAVDPTTLTPAPEAGDRVAFTATQGAVRGGAKWITAVTGFSRAGTGTDLAALRQDLSAAADLVTGLDGYEHELVRVQGTVAGGFGSAGTGFESAQITTMGIPAVVTGLRLRVPTALRTSMGLRQGCTFTTTAPLWRFNTQTQVHAWAAADFTLGTCPTETDAGTDAGTPPVDSGTPMDAGTPPVDSGTIDAGTPDVGTPDAGGAPDTGVPDAGTEPAPTDLWVVRIGSGAAALTNASTAVFIDRVRLSDGMDSAAAIALPVAMDGANNPFTTSGTSDSDGQLTRSVDRRFAVLAGYAVAPGTASVTGTPSSTVRRVVARVSAAGVVDTTTLLGSSFSGNNVRGAASLDGSSFLAIGANTAGAIVSAPLGSPASAMLTPLVPALGNARFVTYYDGAIFGSVATGSQYGVFRVDGNVGTLLPGFPTTGSPTPSPFGFAAFDRDSTPGIDAIYQCSDRALASGGGLQKWTLSGGTWSLIGTYAMGITSGCRSVTGFVDGANVQLFVTTAETVSRIVRFTDNGTAPTGVMGTALRSAATNTVFRGIALAPR